MDDSEDDARYPPNLHPTKPRHYFPSSSSSAPRPKTRFRNPLPPPHFSRGYDDASDDDEEDEADEEEQNYMDQPVDDDEDDDGDGHRRTRNYRDDDDDDGSSSESRGKRRRIDKLALGFEFAPRLRAAAPPKPLARTSPPDWSEDSTFVLLDAWGDRYRQNGRKSLRSDEWNEVAKKVSQASKVVRSDAQCRNRVDTLKKKYKKEKASIMAHGNAGSKWVFFKKMDSLMSSPSPPPLTARQQPPPPPPPRLPCGVDAGEYVFASSSVYRNGYSGNNEMRDSPGDSGTEGDGGEENDSDGLPPQRENICSDSSFKMLAESIQKFGEVYEKMENHKRQQMAELERMRKEFQRDLEVQKRQILERVQEEIAKLREEQVEEDDDEDLEDRDEDNNDGDDGGSAENLSGIISASFYLTAFV
ncbi:hypothetical protein OPV22_029488 [Ensete ventricosum]|uniref:Myb/SANT-like DNA-binding domain-containing protein n=1 Tax=Ensete ventricosum TaxID=4639 RepID=A0AAV8P666_ENSVE|nr:hypothetical protein OPV22_029488 [Ensete ventricosum]